MRNNSYQRRLELDERTAALAEAFVPPRPCPHGDPYCPCQDGDQCHYEGPDAWPTPTEETTAMSDENDRHGYSQPTLAQYAALLAERDDARDEVKRLRGLIVTGAYPPNAGTFAPLVWTEETE